MTLFSTTGHLFLLNRIDKIFNPLLMKVESLFWYIVKRFKIVHMDKSIKGWREQHVQVIIVFELCDPAPMSMYFQAMETFFSASVRCRTLVLSRLSHCNRLLFFGLYPFSILLFLKLATFLIRLALGSCLSLRALSYSTTCTLWLSVRIVFSVLWTKHTALCVL